MTMTKTKMRGHRCVDTMRSDGRSAADESSIRDRRLRGRALRRSRRRTSRARSSFARRPRDGGRAMTKTTDTIPPLSKTRCCVDVTPRSAVFRSTPHGRGSIAPVNAFHRVSEERSMSGAVRGALRRFAAAFGHPPGANASSSIGAVGTRAMRRSFASKPAEFTFGDEDQARRYDDALASQVFRPWCEAMVEINEPVPGNKVLDLACGTVRSPRASRNRLLRLSNPRRSATPRDAPRSFSPP